MEGADIINLPSPSKSESGEIRNSDDGIHEVDSQSNNSETNNGELNPESLELNEGVTGNPESDIMGETEVDKTSADNSSDMQISDDEIIVTEKVEEKLDITCVAHSESFLAEKKMDGLSSSMPTKKRCLDIQNESSSHVMDVTSISSVKRARMTSDDQQPSVHIRYNFLTKASKQRLEELLQKWSAWEAEHGSSSQDQNEFTESGEETYFPALCVGAEKPFAVSFWIDKQIRNQHDTEFSPLDSNNVPLYDRGYAMGLTSAYGSSNLEGGLEIKDDASRCFNCGSYSHSLKQCPRPRDNVAVNAARKQHKSKRNQSNSSRSAVRYYQSTQAGKYDDLKPGVLSAETRKLLGLGELDPPPWLNRMREIGYPPGYLVADDEDQPSGITIFADEEINDEQEDGEISEVVHTEPKTKKIVEFPGINAPIPVEADEKLWAPILSSSESFRSRSHHRGHHFIEPISRGTSYGDFEDEGPPGVDSRYGASYPPRYSDYCSPFSFRSPRDPIRSPISGMSSSERGRRPLVYEDFLSPGSYGSAPQSFSDRHTSPRRIVGSSRYESEIDDRWNNSYPDYSSRSNSHRHYSRR